MTIALAALVSLVVLVMVAMVCFNVWPSAGPSLVRIAFHDCVGIRNQIEIYRSTEGSPDGCLTLSDLVATKKIHSDKSVDPWGSPYVIRCGDEVRVLSVGPDHIEGTADDIRDDFREPDIERVRRFVGSPR